MNINIHLLKRWEMNEYVDCVLNIIKSPWIKCKTLYLKLFNRNQTSNNKIQHYNYNDNFLLIKCPNCHRKSMINRSYSMWHLTNSNTNDKQSSSSINDCYVNAIQSQPTTPSFIADQSILMKSASPSNYCRVATCEKLHIHEITPKCLETFAPSSTCSSCQHCDRQHIGPNHDQLLMVKRLIKDLPLLSMQNNVISNDQINATPTGSLLMQWPLPEYRPQNSPEHLYRRY